MSAPRLTLLACLLAPGCVAYHPQPLSAQATAQSLEARTLADPRLTAFVAAAAPDSVPGRWDLDTLTWAALYYHPSLALSRAQRASAEAAVQQARQRPNPSLGFEEISRTAAGPVMTTITPLISLLIETGGRRAARTREAQARAEAARAALLTQSWRVRGEVREALLDLWGARQQRAVRQAQTRLQEDLTTLREHRLDAGQDAARDVALERTRLAEARLAAEDAQARIEAARARLAAAVGVPVTALPPEGAAPISLDTFDAPVPVPPDSAPLRRAALTERSDVREALGDYAAAEAALALAAAGQYPDLTLQPGYSFDTVQNRYVLLPSLELPLNGNRGAIAVASARRQEAAARLLALQGQILAAVEAAQVEVASARGEEAAGERLLASETAREQQTQRAFEAGALDRPAWLAVQLERNAAALAQRAARMRLIRALGALEDALQHPLLGPAVPPLPDWPDFMPPEGPP